MGNENSSSFPLGPKIGRILEQARKEQGFSLKQVEQATKIRARYLKELERGNFSVLPSVYVRGSLKTYADHLRLDGEALTRELKHQQAAPDEWATPMYDEPPKSDPDPSPVSASSPLAGDEGRTTIEDKEGVSFPSILVGNRFYSYSVSAALVVLLLGAAALALIPIIGKDQGTAFQEEARQPMASPASPTADGKGEGSHQSVQQADDEQRADDEGDGRLLEEQAGPPDRGAEDNGGVGRVGQTGQGQSAPGWTVGSSDATITDWSPTITTVAPITTTKPSATQIRSAPATANPSAAADPSTPTAIEAAQPAPATVNPSAAADPSAPTSTAKPVPANAHAATAEPAALTTETTRPWYRPNAAARWPGDTNIPTGEHSLSEVDAGAGGRHR